MAVGAGVVAGEPPVEVIVGARVIVGVTTPQGIVITSPGLIIFALVIVGFSFRIASTVLLNWAATVARVSPATMVYFMVRPGRQAS